MWALIAVAATVLQLVAGQHEHRYFKFPVGPGKGRAPIGVCAGLVVRISSPPNVRNAAEVKYLRVQLCLRKMMLFINRYQLSRPIAMFRN